MQLQKRPVANFINLFTRSFYARRSQNCKKLLELIVFFALLGSTRVKAARKMLVKLTPIERDAKRPNYNKCWSCAFVPNDSVSTKKNVMEKLCFNLITFSSLRQSSRDSAHTSFISGFNETNKHIFMPKGSQLRAVTRSQSYQTFFR